VRARAKRVAAPQRAVRTTRTTAARTRPSRPQRAPVPPAFAAQRAGASPREQLLFELQRARASVKAAIQGLAAASAARPLARGKWSIHEVVLHLSERDRVRLDEFERTLGGTPRSWAGITDPAMAKANERHLAPLRALSWDAAVRRLDSMREALLERLATVPRDSPAWDRGHAFGNMLWGLPEHDRHHADRLSPHPHIRSTP